MKKLALVLGSLLVVGSVASAKEVVPAPAPAPEVVVKVVEKPVVVYRDRVVEDTKWRPNGTVSVAVKAYDYTENQEMKKAPKWKGEDVHSAEMTAKTSINFTEKQNLSVEVVDTYGYERNHRGTTGNSSVELAHTYDFGKINGTEIGASMGTTFTREGGEKSLEFAPSFDFSGYFFKNDYVKATSLSVTPSYTYTWYGKETGKRYANDYALNLNAGFELPYGVSFGIDLTNTYGKLKKLEGDKEGNKAYKYGEVEFTLGYGKELYANGKHSISGDLSASYETEWAWSKNDKSIEEAGTEATANHKKAKWGEYTATFEPSATYTYAATEYVKLHTTLGAEYKNRSGADRHNTKHWRWQPYAEVGFKASF